MTGISLSFDRPLIKVTPCLRLGVIRLP